MARTVSMGGILGLNNRLAPVNMVIQQIGKSSAWLQAASNIDLTAGGLMVRRQGMALSGEGEHHSLWADAKAAYVVCGGHLSHLDIATKALTVVVPDVGTAPVCFARLPDGLVYWSNGSRIGRLDGKVARAIVTPAPNPVPVASAADGSLPAGRYQVCFTALGEDGESPSTVPQDVDLPHGGGLAISGLPANTLVYATGPDGEVFNEIAPGDYLSLGNTGAACTTLMLSSMPAGSAIAHYRGSLLVASGKFLFISQPYQYGLLDLGRSFIPFPAEITVVMPCEDGVYVCADQTYWIPGDPLNTSPVVVLPFGGLKGSGATDPSSKTVYWQGPHGVLVGRPGGQVSAPQDDAMTFAGAAAGATLVRNQGGETHIVAARLDVESE